ncbi:sulfite exporter TauE/SafE family protein [Marinobacteraceae bacterium S3BR75-40.1]
MMEYVALFVMAVVANGLSALAGGGAGLLQLPALLLLGLPFPLALATHKVASVALGVGASVRHARERSLRPGFALFMLACGLPGVVSGAWIIVLVPEAWARLALGVLTLGLGIYSLASPDLGLKSERKHRSLRGYLIGGLGLMLIGVLNGSITSGTGLFVTLWLVFWFGLDYTRAVAYTLVLVGLFWNGVGAGTLALRSDIAWHWVPPLLAGAVIGGYAGAHWSIARGSQWVKWAFEAMTFLVGLALLADAAHRLLQ